MNDFKIIFLDIDGVLNSREYMKKIYLETGKPWSHTKNMLDPKCLALLKELVEEENAYIVLSSTIRRFEDDMITFFASVGNTIPRSRFVGQTPYLHGLPRGAEIENWISTHKHSINDYIILDDDADMLMLSDHLIQTSFETGLTEDNIDEAKRMFKRKTR